MHFFNRVWNTFDLNKEYDEFELLETESGEPNLFSKGKKKNPYPKGVPTIEAQSGLEPNQELTRNYDKNIKILKDVFHASKNSDVVFREFKIASRVRACVIFMNGMTNANLIDDYILRQAMNILDIDAKHVTIDYLKENIISIAELSKLSQLGEITYGILAGMAALLVEKQDEVLMMDTRGFEHRSIAQPRAEKAIVGPHEAFVENLRTNITMIRRVVQTPDLVCEFKHLGGENNVQVAILHRDGITNARLLKEVEKKLAKINTRFAFGEGMTQQLIEDRKASPIPQILNTERPDRAGAMLMSGHVVILFDYSPYCMILPATFFSFMSAPDDSYLRKPFADMMKLVRYAGLLASIFLPGIYVALLNYHPSIISAELIDTIMESRMMISVGVQYEMLFLMVVFQLVRECGVRVPGEMGQSLSVIAALVLGQASVSANIVSSIMLIIVAITGLGNYCIPDVSLQMSATWVSIMLVAAASFGGLMLMSACVVVLLVYMCSIKSFGVPFFAPFAPKTFSNKRSFGSGFMQMENDGLDYTNEEG